METNMRRGLFSARRFGHIILRDVAGGYRSLLIAMAAVAGAVVVLSALTALGISSRGPGSVAGGGGFYLNFFRNILFLGGFIVTSLAFHEIRQNGAGMFYLTLPGSLFEKLLSKLLITSVGYAVGSALFITAASTLSEVINRLLFGFGHGFFNPFDPTVLKMAAVYLVTQSIFLLGSIWFRKIAFLKTMLWIIIFAIGAAIVFGVAARFILPGQLAGHGLGWSMNLGRGQLFGMLGPGARGYAGLPGFTLAARILFYGALAPVCWLAAYFKLGEVEV